MKKSLLEDKRNEAQKPLTFWNPKKAYLTGEFVVP